MQIEIAHVSINEVTRLLPSREAAAESVPGGPWPPPLRTLQPPKCVWDSVSYGEDPVPLVQIGSTWLRVKVVVEARGRDGNHAAGPDVLHHL